MDDFKEQIKAIDEAGQATIEKIDKKLTVIVFQLSDMADHEGRIKCLEDVYLAVKTNIGLIKWVGGTVAALGTVVTGWLAFFNKHAG